MYVICGEGRIDIFRAESGDRYRSEGLIQTAPRARTGLFVPEDGKLYVAAPAIASIGRSRACLPSKMNGAEAWTQRVLSY